MVPNLVSNGILSVAGAAALTALIVQQTKFLVEYVVKPTNNNHDAILRLYVDLVAIAVVVIAEGVSGILNIHNGQQWFSAILQGFGVALAAISGYHVLNGMQPQTPATPAAAPASNTGVGAVEPGSTNGAAAIRRPDELPLTNAPVLEGNLIATPAVAAPESHAQDNGTTAPGMRSISMSFVGGTPRDETPGR